MPIDRKVFFEHARTTLFGGSLAQTQVDGMTAILDEWDRRAIKYRFYLAYMLATVYHECARTMQPVREGLAATDAWRKAHLRYYPWYGRGFVQLTWKTNYKRAADEVGVDLIANPDLALRLDVATKILFDGMLEGWFTGKKLADYLGDYGRDFDYVGARRIINGTDKAEAIAGYARDFLAAITAAAVTAVGAIAPAPTAKPLPTITPPTTKPLPPMSPDKVASVGGAAAVAVGVGTAASVAGLPWWVGLIAVGFVAVAVIIIVSHLRKG